MFEADPLAMASLAHSAVDVLAQAGPPTELPAQAPDFVGSILGEIGGAAADGLGQTISDLTPSGESSVGEAANGAADAAAAASDHSA